MSGAYDRTNSNAEVPVQGMSDLLAPFLDVFPIIEHQEPDRSSPAESDWMAFACFSLLLRHVRGNFLTGMVKLREDLSCVSNVLAREDSSLIR